MKFSGLVCAMFGVALLACRPHSGPRHPASTDPLAGLAIEHYRLANGLEVVLQPDPSVSSVVVHVWYHVGSKDESPGKTGFAHLFEHLMFEGSKHVGEGQFDLLLEEAGGWNNGSTNNDRTNYYEQVPANQLALALWLEADRMAGLWDAMNQQVLDNQRDVVKNERRQSYENRPYGLADIMLPELLWPTGHGNAHSAIGSMEDLSSASLADVEAFWRTFYLPANATIVIAGGIDVATAKKLVAAYFGWMPNRPRPVAATAAPLGPMERAITHDLTDAVSTEKVILAWRAPAAYTQDTVALQVLAYVLAGSETGRLYRRMTMRDQSAFEVAAFVDTMKLGSEFHIHALGRDGVSVDALAKTILEELAAIAARGVTTDELARAKRMIESSLLRGFESLSSRAETLAEYTAYTGNPRYAAEDLATLARVTSADLQRLTKAWLAPTSALRLNIRPAAKGVP